MEWNLKLSLSSKELLSSSTEPTGFDFVQACLLMNLLSFWNMGFLSALTEMTRSWKGTPLMFTFCKWEGGGYICIVIIRLGDVSYRYNLPFSIHSEMWPTHHLLLILLLEVCFLCNVILILERKQCNKPNLIPAGIKPCVDGSLIYFYNPHRGCLMGEKKNASCPKQQYSVRLCIFVHS